MGSVLERKGAKRHRKLEIWGAAGCSKITVI